MHFFNRDVVDLLDLDEVVTAWGNMRNRWSKVLRRAHTQRFQSADSGLDGCFQQKQSVIGSVGSSTSPDLPISYT